MNHIPENDTALESHRPKAAGKPLQPGDWQFQGWLGERIRTVAEARLLTDEAWARLYPQTEEAFRMREDDRSHPGRGVWRGEFWGKYILSAIAACRYYRSDSLKRKIENAVAGLLETQDENGYIGTYGNSLFLGKPTWNIWCRKYTLWGLLEAWELLGDDNILQAIVRFMDHLLAEVGPGRYDLVQTGQFYGLPSTSILKPVVLVYHATGEPRYLEFARYIVDQWTAHPEGLPDLLRKGLSGEPIHTWFDQPYKWAKSYEFVSCVEGLLALYRVTGTASYLKAATNIHAAIMEWERSAVGSMSFNDKFIGSRFLINTVAEICDAVYWNRLSWELLLLTGDVHYMDEIERTLYNSLLCGMSPDGMWGLRRLRCSHEHIPAHEHFMKQHQCCVDNLPRGLFQAAQSAVMASERGLYVCLYEAGGGTIALPGGQNVSLQVTGDFMLNGEVHLTLSAQQSTTFDLRLRIPAWSRTTVVAAAGQEHVVDQPGSWFTLERAWGPDDTVTIRFDMSVYTEVFDPSRYEAHDPIVAWHEQTWASMGFIGEADMDFNQTSSLSLSDALPHRKAVMFFRGPIALARDVRLGGTIGLFAPLTESEAHEPAELEPIPAPEGIWRAYEMKLASGRSLPLCDFASAGNTWDKRSAFSGWQLIQDEE